jgi:branched-chain amino acid transport system permease protein
MANFWRGNRSILITTAIALGIVAIFAQGLEPKVWVSILLSGLTLAALYFLVASGLSLIFGLMDVLNFAHGVLFVLGAYVGLSTFANPRLLFNTAPFLFVVSGGAVIGQRFGKHFWRLISVRRTRRILWWALILISAGIVAFGLRRFPIRELNAFNITAVGGAVTTEEAQEPLGLMIQRVSLLILAGLPLGVTLAPKERHEEGPERPAWQSIAMAVGLIALGYAILIVRTPGEAFMLGLSVNLRFLLAILFGALAGGLAGSAIEVVLIRPFYGNPVTQLVLTLGLWIAGTDLIEAVFGEEANPPMEPPSLFNASCRSESLAAWFSEQCRSIDVLGRAFPTYRLFIIFVGLAVFIGVGLLLRRSRIGMIIRAGVQDSEMVQAMGINVRRVFTLVFALGSGLAALGGVIAAPFLGVYPAMGGLFLVQSFIAVVIGGMGSYAGAAVGTLLLGLARAFGDHFVAAGINLPFLETTLKGSPAIARASTVLIMAIVLLVSPSGIFGKKE